MYRAFSTLTLTGAVLLLATSGMSLLTPVAALYDPVNATHSSASLASLVKDRYIIKLNSQTSPQAFLDSHRSKDNVNIARKLNQRNAVDHTYDIDNFHGFAARLTTQEVRELKEFQQVEYVESVSVVRVTAISGALNATTQIRAQVPRQSAEEQENPPSWGLTRISQRKRNLNASFYYPQRAGQGVDVWVIDTGINVGQPDFQGRARNAASMVRGESNRDYHGHGTHVSGTIASKTYGVAKYANVIGVKVISRSGDGTNSDVIAGINYVVRNRSRNRPTVINMSLGGSYSRAVNDAVKAAVRAGVAVVVAAGNDSEDACQASPASAADAFTVAASGRNDQEADFSNYGRCVDVYGPGVGIKSLWKGARGATNTISGTSMASPHVAGVAATFLSTGLYKTPRELYAAMRKEATADVIHNANSVNQLIFNHWGGQ